MVDSTIELELSTCLNQLPLEQQRQVLEFARTLVSPAVRGMRGDRLLQFAGTIDPADLQSMSQAIKDGCERIDTDEW